MTVPSRIGLAAIVLCSLATVACGSSAEDHFARADAYAKEGKHAEAVVEFRQALQENQQYGEAYYRLAQSSEQIQDYANAARNYILAGQFLPDNADVQIQSASMLLLGQRFDEALIAAERVLQREPDNVRAHILHAHALSGLKRTGQALASIQKAIALDPTRGETYGDFGIFQFVTGSLEQGEENLRRAAEANPPSAPAQMTLASLYWAQGRLADAEKYLKRAVEIDTSDVRASRALATFYLGNNRTDEAEQHLQAIAKRSQTIASQLALADYYIVLDRNAEAVRILEGMIAGSAEYAEARSRLAAMRYAGGEFAAAHQMIDETLKKEPRSSRALLTKANFLLAERKLDQGLTMLKAAVAADPRSIPAQYALAMFHAASQDVAAATTGFNQILEIDPKSIPAKMELARLHLATGNADLASRLAQQAAEARPSLDTSLLFARTLVARGEISRAETLLRPFVDSTARADLLSLAGGVYAGIGESARGRTFLEKAARLNPDAAEPIENLVGMDLAAGNVARAKSLADDRLARRPKDPRLLILAARTYGAGGETERMIATLRAAIQAAPESTAAYALLGQVLAAQGKPREALAEFERVIARDPRSVSAQTMVAFLLEQLGRTADAEQRYRRVLELDPRAPVANNNLAWLIVDRNGNLDEALQLAQMAKGVMPEAPDVNDTLAWVYYRRDLPELALSPMRLAIERDPKNATYQHHAGLIYLKTGDIEAARSSFETALKLDPKFSRANEAREALARLQ